MEDDQKTMCDNAKARQRTHLTNILKVLDMDWTPYRDVIEVDCDIQHIHNIVHNLEFKATESDFNEVVLVNNFEVGKTKDYLEMGVHIDASVETGELELALTVVDSHIECETVNNILIIKLPIKKNES